MQTCLACHYVINVLTTNICIVFQLFAFRVQKLLDAAKYSYILPTHRATIYLIGVLMAYFMRTNKLHVTLSNVSYFSTDKMGVLELS